MLLIFLDIGATIEGRNFLKDTLQKVSENCFVPLTAGAYANNIGSIKAFKKAKFIQECIRKNHFLYKRKYIDYVLLARFKK